MAWDLWSSPYDQVVHDGNYSEHTGWQCDFYFGCGYDVIEEDALNEKSCIDVLRILIRKEDTEIGELEKDLLSLQSELACAEHEKWPEFCFSGLSEKINWLDVSIRTLKNHHADDSGTQPLLPNKPAEPLHEIMKALQRDYCQDARGQELLAKDCARCANLRAISSASGHSDGMKLSDTSNLQVSGNEEDRRQLVTKDRVQIPYSSFSKDMENAPKEAEIEQERNAIVAYDSAYASRVAAGIGAKDTCLGSILSDSQQPKSGNDGNSYLDQKICDFASKSEGRVCSKELIAPDEDLDHMKPTQVVYPQELCLPANELSSLTRENGKNPPQAMNVKTVNPTPAKPQTKIIPYCRSRQKDEGKSQAWGRKSRTYANLSKSNMSLPSKRQNQWKKKPDMDAVSDKEQSNSPIKLLPKASTILTSRGQQKPCTSIISVDEGRSNKSLLRKVTEKEVQPSKHETGEHAIVLYDSEFSELQKKRKVDAIVPYGSEFSELQKKRKVDAIVPYGSEFSELQNKKKVDAIVPYDTEFSELQKRKVDAQTSNSQPDKLKDLKVNDLRVIAKKHNLKRYYKLNKGALIELLKQQLYGC